MEKTSTLGSNSKTLSPASVSSTSGQQKKENIERTKWVNEAQCYVSPRRPHNNLTLSQNNYRDTISPIEQTPQHTSRHIPNTLGGNHYLKMHKIHIPTYDMILSVTANYR